MGEPRLPRRTQLVGTGPLASVHVRRVASLAELELDRVLGMPLSAQVAADLIALDARLDRLERSPRRNGWVVGHMDPNVASGQPLSVVLDRTLSYPSAADDSLELAVNVWQRDADDLLVEVTVEVYCFCDANHTIHRAAEKEWIARSDTELRDVLTAAVSSAEAWSARGLDADQWRARVGLPNRR